MTGEVELLRSPLRCRKAAHGKQVGADAVTTHPVGNVQAGQLKVLILRTKRLIFHRGKAEQTIALQGSDDISAGVEGVF